MATTCAPERLAGLLAPVDPAAVEFVRGVEYTFRAQVADRWRAGRVLLAGDAAHLSPPFVGQGLGLGLRDVHQLAWKLAAVLAGEAGDDLLDTYQAEREPHARALIRVALLLGRLMTGGGRAGDRRPPGCARRRPPHPGRGPAGDRQPDAAAAARARWSSAAGGPDGGWRARWSRSRRSLVDGRRCRLDDVLGPGAAQLTADLLVRRADGTEVAVEDPTGRLAAWLRGTTAVQVRPDRIVRSAT